MKRGLIIGLLAIVLTMALFVSAEGCGLDISMINQDPYPAVPGDYVKLVFQIDGIAASTCGDVTFELLEQYPIQFDPGADPVVEIKAGTHTADYESFAMVPYKVRIDKEALDGDNPIEVRFSYSKGGLSSEQSKQFDLNIEDIRADFEIYVKDYSYKTHELTLEVLNVVDVDVEALTLEIPKQDIIDVKGPNRLVVGDLDSNEYTTADFETTINEGFFKVNLIYSDTINTRRIVEKTISFDPAYFTERIADQKNTGTGTYIFWGIVVVVIGWIILKRFKKKKKK
jgi:hypothetical protein